MSVYPKTHEEFGQWLAGFEGDWPHGRPRDAFYEDIILSRYLSLLEKPRGDAYTLAWMFVEQYLEAARVQVRRIDRDRRMIERSMQQARDETKSRWPRMGRRRRDNIWADAHYYFIAWHMIGRLLRHIDELSQLKSLKTFMRAKRRMIDRYIEIRDHLEHWTERLPGGPQESAWHGGLGETSEKREPDGYYFGFGRKNWDISMKSLRELESLVRGFHITLVKAAHANERFGRAPLPLGARSRARHRS